MTTRQFADASPVGQPTLPFSFPLCDLLICEFNQVDTVLPLGVTPRPETKTNLYKPSHPFGIYRGRLSPKSKAARQTLCELAQLIYQKVVSRKPVPFQVNPTLPNLACYVEETLECGHVTVVYPGELETLTARKRSCHECAGAFGGLLLGNPAKKRAQSIAAARRKMAGQTPWWALGFAVGCASLLVFAVASRWPKTFYYSYPTDYLRVVQRLNDRDFMVQRVDHGKALDVTMMRFCSDYLPWVEGGHTFSWIRYDDHRSCQSIGPEDRGFDVVRDSKGLPVLAPNCHFDWSTPNGHVVCDGGMPKFEQ